MKGKYHLNLDDGEIHVSCRDVKSNTSFEVTQVFFLFLFTSLIVVFVCF